MANLINEILNSLILQNINSQLIEEIKEKISNNEYRQAFLIIENLKETKYWIPNENDEENLQSFWWDYAN
jgi:hypothetical protein